MLVCNPCMVPPGCDSSQIIGVMFYYFHAACLRQCRIRTLTDWAACFCAWSCVSETPSVSWGGVGKSEGHWKDDLRLRLSRLPTGKEALSSWQLFCQGQLRSRALTTVVYLVFSIDEKYVLLLMFSFTPNAHQFFWNMSKWGSFKILFSAQGIFFIIRYLTLNSRKFSVTIILNIIILLFYPFLLALISSVCPSI